MNLNHIAKKPFFDLFNRTPCMPTLVRLCFHDAGTYDPATGQGGADASIIYEMDRPDSAGLQFALDKIKEVKENGNHITDMLSMADLIQLGGICGIQYCGGPTMTFKMGRKDATHEGPTGNLPDPAQPHLMSAVFHRMGFSDQQIVAIMGVHTLGKAKMDTSGYEGTWTMNPYVFDNTYYKELLMGDKSKYLQTESDVELVLNPNFKPFVEMYAQDQEKFFEDYAEAHDMLGSMGQEQNLICEIEQF
jgi:L-ascorbate peroxidase